MLLVNRGAQVPLHQQLYQALRTAIRRGQLRSGARLPSSRILAERVGVSRNTVLNAYESLAADGLVQGRIGAGTRVANVHGTSRRLTLKDPDGTPIMVVE